MRSAAPLLVLRLLTLALPAGAAADEEIGDGLPAPTFSLRAMNPDAAGAQWVSLDTFVGAEATDPGAGWSCSASSPRGASPAGASCPSSCSSTATYRDAAACGSSAVAIDREEPGIEAARRMVGGREA